MGASFVAELMKLRRRAAVWIIVAVWLTLTVLFDYVFPFLNYRGSPTGPAGDAEVGERVLVEALPESLASAPIQGFPLFAGALALLIGVLATGGEYGWQTMKAVLTQGPGRLNVLAGKVLALLVSLLGLVLVTYAVSAAASLLAASLTDHPADWPPIVAVGKGIAGGWLIVGMWCVAGVFLATALRGTAVAAGIGLVWALAVENLLRLFGAIVGAVDVVQRFLPGTNAGALVAALGVGPEGQSGGTPGVTTVVGGAQATCVLLAYLAVFAVVAGALLRRRDIS